MILLPIEAEAHIVEKDGSVRRLEAEWQWETPKDQPRVGFFSSDEKNTYWNEARTERARRGFWEGFRRAEDAAFMGGPTYEPGPNMGKGKWAQRERRRQMMMEQFNEQWAQILEAQRKRR